MDVISLNDWLEVAQQSGVAYVPAERLGYVSLLDILQTAEQGKEPSQRLRDAMTLCEANAEEGFMLRWGLRRQLRAQGQALAEA